MAKETFRDSFKPHHLLKSDAVCSLKKHYLNVLREVVGYLELLASNDPQRFVWPSVPDIVKHCTKYSKGRTPYEQHQVENALRFLRDQNVISRRVERERLGVMRRGFIVTPHDSLCVRTKNCCEFKGQLKASGNWEAEAGIPGTWWAVPTVYPAVSTAVHPAVITAAMAAVSPAVSNAKSCVEGCGEGCGTESPQNADGQTSYQIDEKVLPTFSESSGAPSLVNHSSVATEVTVPTDSAERRGQDTARSLKSMNDETGGHVQGMKESKTIGQHFGIQVANNGTKFVWFDDFELVTDGELNDETKQWQEWGYENQIVLRDLCRNLVCELSEQPYEGRKTNAFIMDAAMKRFIKQHGRVPAAWLKVMNDLRRQC